MNHCCGPWVRSLKLKVWLYYLLVGNQDCIVWPCEKWETFSWPVGHFDPPPPASFRVNVKVYFLFLRKSKWRGLVPTALCFGTWNIHIRGDYIPITMEEEQKYEYILRWKMNRNMSTWHWYYLLHNTNNTINSTFLELRMLLSFSITPAIFHQLRTLAWHCWHCIVYSNVF